MSQQPTTESELALGLTLRDRMMYTDTWAHKTRPIFEEDIKKNRNPFQYNATFIRVVLELLPELPAADIENQLPFEFWQLLWAGILHDAEITNDLPGRMVRPLTLRRRVLELFVQDRATLEWIIDTDVKCLHYTGSASLESVLRHGLVGRAQQARLQTPATPNGYLDSSSGEHFVSLDQWHSPEFYDYYFTQGSRPDFKFVSPLTKENLRRAIQECQAEVERWYRMYDPHHSTTRMIADELKLANIQRTLEEYDQTVAALGTGLSPELYIANFPVVFLTQEPEHWRIPHGDIETEIVTPSIGPQQIKGLVVPTRHLAITTTAVAAAGLQTQIKIIDMEKFRQRLYPHTKLQY